MRAFSVLLLLGFCLHCGPLCCALRAQSPLLSPANPPETQSLSPVGPAPFSSPAPTDQGSSSRRRKKHHRKTPHAPAPSIPSFGEDCDGIICSEPLTATAIGSPCGCVLPISVVLDLGVAPYVLFTRIAEFEVEIATGTFLKQSQVKIMAASTSSQDQGRTRVTVYLVPLGERFDYTTASLIYERLWQKKLPINMTLFGDYEVVDVHYPGLPSSPPSSPVGPTRPRNPGNSQYPLTADVPPKKSRKLTTGIIIVISISSFILILACFGVIFFICKWVKLQKEATPVNPPLPPSTAKRSGIRTIMSNSMASSTSLSIMSTMAACIPPVKTFTMAELRKATNEFSSDKILGEGGFGVVYHGILDDGNDAAIKLLSKGDPNTDREFIAEVEMLSRLHHRNLVKLIGICIEGNQRCLVYELVRNGSVESHLHGIDKEKSPLDWDARMKIALGAARGLAYLHEDSNPRVIHRDFKASNVLLEEDFTPKVTDFGLAREASEGSNHISTRVMGTFGYVAPEYAMTGHLLVKSDVYSYGVVLLELLTGRKPVYISESQGPENLVTWARPLLTSREGIEKLIDPSLHGNYDMNDVARAAAIASMCVHIEPSQRPFMGEVVQALKLIYNPKDESCGDSSSQKESSCGIDQDPGGDFCAESSWWRNSLGLPYGPGSPFVTMEYSSDTPYEIRVPHSASQLVERPGPITRHSGSGPLRTKTKRMAAFYRLRGCISERGQLSRSRGTDGHFDPSF